ncbi:MAG: hypothetical protein OXI79_06195 [Gammaproteobacteria bacterium]|nr:hypothetical protein [Gammaproteobacteria bacterium]
MASGDNKQPDTETSRGPQRRTLSLPSWLDGRTIAILTGMVSIAAMVQTSHSGLSDDIHRLRDEMYAMRTELRQEFRGEIGGLRYELTARIEKLDERLRKVEIDLAAIRTHLMGFDARPPHDEPQHEPS